ncbi:MAG: LacI family DNA-binding transcriptional regulator [Fusobacteriaceae bacterium]
MAKNINIKTVANLANVSVATVSRVLNNSEKVKNSTKKKVLEIIKSLNYEPNMLGSTLRNSESKNILVFIPNLRNLFYTEILEGIEETLHKNLYRTIICSTELSSDKSKVYFNLLKQKLADGAIVLDPKINSSLENFHDKSIRIVQLCEKSLEGNFSYVGINNEQASYDVVSLLIKKNRKRIILLNSDKAFWYANEREAGYKRALQKNNIKFDQKMVLYSNAINYESGETSVMKFLEKSKDVDAIYAVSDMLAIGAIRALKKLKIEIPKDISVIGFDDIEIAKLFSPELSTVSQPMKKMGRCAAEILLKEIKKPSTLKQKIILDYEIIERETT